LNLVFKILKYRKVINSTDEIIIMATILELTKLTIPQLFFEFFLPFALTLVIMFAVLQMTRLFRNRINLMISLIVTILVATTPLFGKLATMVSRWGSYTALIAFVAVFIVGVLSWTFRKGGEYVTGTIDEIRRLKNEIRKLENKMRTEGNPEKRMSYARQLSDDRRLVREYERYGR